MTIQRSMWVRLGIFSQILSTVDIQAKNDFLKQLCEENSKLESIESYLKDFKPIEGLDTQEEYDEVKGQILGNGETVS